MGDIMTQHRCSTSNLTALLNLNMALHIPLVMCGWLSCRHHPVSLAT
jgi:hypothetical protein